MLIQWYPGHMHKAGKEIKAILSDIDLIIEILDARIPFSSQNPMLARLRADKPCIKVLNKSDLADPIRTQIWQAYLEQEEGVKTIALTSEQPERIRQLTSLCHKMVSIREGQLLRTLIMGIPNVGKSTIINILAGRTIAKTGNEPAITKMLQRIDIGDGIILLDSPGMLWPNLENKNSGYRLASTGAIKDTAIQHDDIAVFLAEFLLEHYPKEIMTRFQFAELPEHEMALLEMIGKQRGCLRAGGKIDSDKVAKIIISEFRDGILGRMTMELPAMMVTELAELEIIRSEKAAKKLLRKKSK